MFVLSVDEAPVFGRCGASVLTRCAAQELAEAGKLGDLKAHLKESAVDLNADVDVFGNTALIVASAGGAAFLP